MRLRGANYPLAITVVTIAIVPVLIWLLGAPTTAYPAALAAIVGTVLGTVLATVVFMLWAAQNARQMTLDDIVAEFEERDRRLCAAAASSDPEPWPPQMVAELQHVETMAALTALLPAERRSCSWSRRQRATALRKIRAIEAEAARRVSEALVSGPVVEDLGEGVEPSAPAAPGSVPESVSRWVAVGLTPGRDGSLPEAVRRSWDWPKASRHHVKLQQRAEELRLEYEQILSTAMSRLEIMAGPGLSERGPSGLALRYEGVLSADVRPLQTAYVLTLAVLSLSAVTLVYSRQVVLWPVPPGLLAAATIAAISIVYIGHVSRAMTETSMATAWRLRRLAVPAMHDASVLLGDQWVVRATSPGHPAQASLQHALGCLGAVEVPLRHRLLGEYHLALAWRALPRRHAVPCTADFCSFPDVEQSAAVAVVHELQLARDHLERSVSVRSDDPVALLALDGVLDAMAAASGRRTPNEAGARAAEAVLALARPGPNGPDWVGLVGEHRWLWPREPGRLTELVP